jgi:Domain of unknown function (DUF4169)
VNVAEVVNLRTVRKQKERDAARARGIEAAAKSGRSKALKALEKARAEKEARDLEGHRREGGD